MLVLALLDVLASLEQPVAVQTLAFYVAVAAPLVGAHRGSRWGWITLLVVAWLIAFVALVEIPSLNDRAIELAGLHVTASSSCSSSSSRSRLARAAIRLVRRRP
jgi:hypothetical protein